MTKLRQGLIASTIDDRSYKLLSYNRIGNLSEKPRAHYLKRDAYRENVIGEKRRFENQVARPLSPSSSRRRAWSSEISDFSRAREGGKSNLRGRSRDQKKMEKRGKVEGPGSPEGIER